MSEPQPTTSSLQPRAARLISLIFVLVCSAPLMVTCGEIVSGQAHARPAFPARPQSASQLITWPERFVDYFSENFGLRDSLLNLHVAVKLRLFGPDAGPRVLHGNDGWLFFADEGVLDYTRGRPPFTPQELDAWTQLFTKRKQWLAERGIRYVVMVCPNSHSIYPEHLRSHLPLNPRHTRLDQLIEALHGKVDILDLRKPLRAAKHTWRLYHKTDTHWNLIAGKLAAQELFGWASGTEDSRPFDERIGTVTPHERPGGDLSRFLGLEHSWVESDLVPDDYRPAKSSSGQPIPENYMNVHMAGDVTTVSTQPGRVLVFSDSFGQVVLPWTAVHFGRVRWIWTDGFYRNVVEQEKPDIVVQQFVERKLQWLNPREVGE